MKYAYAIIIFCLFHIAAGAQSAVSYIFNQSSGTYTALSSPTNIFTGSWDDNTSNGRTIGFTFNHCGTNYTTFNINANGWINFGSSVSSSYTPISARTHVVAALGGDLYRRSGSTISSKLTGSSPNRVLTIQWDNVCHYSSSSTGPLNFQIKLYETSNRIEIVYGNFSPSSSSSYNYHVGINGNATSDYNNRTTTSNWSGTTAGTSNSATCRQNKTIKPATGLTFRWCPPVPAISGTGSVCPGSSVTLSNSLSGGIWATSNTSVAVVGSGTGVVTGVSGGTATISYISQCGAAATRVVTVYATPAVPTGSSSVCAGSTITLTNSSGSGTWASSSNSIATVGSATGVVAGVAAGTARITFTLSSTGCTNSKAITVNAAPAAISGPTSLCSGFTSTFSNATSGGAWSSSNTSLATIGSATGIATGVATGTLTISYTLPTGCRSAAAVTVNPLPSTISGAGTVCGSLSTTLGNATTGGTWTSGNTAFATVGSTSGVVTGGSAGTVNISYTLPSGCFVAHTMSVIPFSAITGVPSMCLGYSTTLTNATSGGTWSSSNTSVATVSSGYVSSVSLGTTTITYSISSTGCTATLPVIVTNPPSAYTVTGGGSLCSGGTGVHVGLGGSDAGIIYQLYNGSSVSGTPVSGTGGVIDFGLRTSPGTYGVIANPGTPCSRILPGTVTININPLPVSYTVSGGGNYCSGGAGLHVYLNASSIGINYQLYNGSTPVGSPVPGTSAALDFGLQTTAGTYTVVGTNAITSCVNNMAGSAVISIDPVPNAFSLTGGGAYCSDGTGRSIGLSGSQSGVAYQLYYGGSPLGAPLTGTGSSLAFGIYTTAGVYTVIATNSATGCAVSMPGAATISVNPLPAAFNVSGGGNYCSGGSGVNVGIDGSAVGINYQLYRGGIVVGSPLPGTGALLSFGLQTIAGVYTVVATNASTLCVSNMSGSVTVAINPLPSVFSVTGGGAYCSGGSGRSIGLSGSVTGTNYQLYTNGVLTDAASGSGGAIDFGLKTAAGSYTVVAMIVATGCSAAMTGSASITINSLPVSTYTITGGGNYCAGGTGRTIGLSGSQSGIRYQLLVDGTPAGTALTGTGSALSFGSKTTPGIYTIVATNNATTCTSTMTGSVFIGIDPLPYIYSVTGGGAYCSGTAGVRIQLSNSDAGISYQLYNGSTATGPAITGVGYSLDFGLKTDVGTYTIIARNAVTTCTSDMAGSAVVALSPLPTDYPVTGGGSYCSGGTGVHIGLTSSSAGVDYQLKYMGGAIGAPMPGAGAAIDFGLMTLSGTYTIVATDAVTGCVKNMTGSAVIAVNPLPVAYFTFGGGSYCPGGGGVHVKLNASNTGVYYQLYRDTTQVGAPVPGTGGLLNLGLQTVAGTYTFKATNASTGCMRNMTGRAVVSIHALPNQFGVTGGGSYCSGGAGLHVGLSGSTPGIRYQLYRGTTPSGFPVTGTGAAIDFGLRTTAGTYSVKATNLITGCSVYMVGSKSILVNPKPLVKTVTGGGSYCPGGVGVSVGLSGSEPGVNYQLYRGFTPAGLPVAGNGGPLSFGLITSAGVYTVIATNATTACTRLMSGSVSVSIAAMPHIYAVTGGGNYCPGDPGVNVGLSGSNSGISYQLYNGSVMVGLPVLGSGFALDFGLQTTAGVYTVEAKGNTTSCTINMSGSALVGINPLPATYAVTGGGHYCFGGSGLHIGLSGSTVGNSYQLYNGVAIGSPVPGTGAALDFGLQTTNGVYSVIATNDATSCISSMTGNTGITIDQLPVGFTVTGGGSYCAGGTGVSIGLGNSATGVDYQLYNGLSAVGDPVSGSGMAINFGSQTANGIYTVKATDMATTCSQRMPGIVRVAIDPVPGVYTVTGGGSYCYGGEGLHLFLSGSDAGIYYQLYNESAMVGAPLPGTGLSLNFGLQTAPGNYRVVAANEASACTSNMSGGSVISVDPKPVAYGVTGGGSYCAGTAGVHLGLSGSQAGVSYQLYNGASIINSPVSGTGLPLDFGPVVFAGTYSVVATTTATGCTNRMTGSATININPQPAVYTVTGGGGYCIGSSGVSIGLSGSNVGIAYQLYNGTTTVGSPVLGTGGALNFGLQTITGIYSVVAENLANSCIRNMPGTATIVVNPLPLAHTVMGGGAYCSGGTGVHIGLDGSDHGITYQLMQGTTIIGAPVVATGGPLDFGLQTTAGDYSVIASNATTGCSVDMPGIVNVHINSLPRAYSVTGGGNYCPGGSGAAIGVSSSEAGVTYRLYNGVSVTGVPVTGTGLALDFGLQTAPGTYTIIATNNTTGCLGNMSGSAVVTINALPVRFNVTGGGHYCDGGSGVHIGLSNTSATASYQLHSGTDPVGLSVAGTGAAIDFGRQTMAGTYTVIATDLLATCTNLMAGSAVVTIDTVVTTGVTVSSSHGDIVCSGSLITLTAEPVNGGLSPVYQWTVNGVIAGINSNYAYIPLNGDVVAVKMISSLACVEPLTASNSMTLHVEDNGVPLVNISSNHGTEVCVGTLVDFIATPYFGGSAPSYQWIRNGVNAGTASMFSYIPSDGDVVNCVMTSNYHCRLGNVSTSNQLTMQVDVPKTPDISLTVSPGINISSGQAVTIAATISDGGPSPTFEWRINGTIVPGAISQRFVSNDFVEGDIVTCKVLSSGACSGIEAEASIVMHVHGVGVARVHELNGGFLLIPNPSNGTFNIKGKLLSGADTEVLVEITNMVGQLIYADNLIAQNGEINSEIQLSNTLANGMYILCLRSGTDRKVFHLVLER